MTAFNVWASRARQIGNGRNPPDRDPRIGRGNGRCGATAHAQPITAGWLIRAGNGRSSREVDRLIFVPRCPRTDRARSCGARRRLRAGAPTAEQSAARAYSPYQNYVDGPPSPGLERAGIALAIAGSFSGSPDVSGLRCVHSHGRNAQVGGNTYAVL